ncbi:MAG: Tn3 family transposase [Terriglobia bacterium]
MSCGPREALYALDGLLESNTILRLREHTTDTLGFTEHVFALSYLWFVSQKCDQYPSDNV